MLSISAIGNDRQFVLAGIRLLTIALLMVYRVALPESAYHAFFIAMVIGHNVATVIFSRQRIAAVSNRPEIYWKIAIIAGLGLWSWQYYQTTFLYIFCLHHALSETYTLNPSNASGAQWEKLSWIRMGLNYFIFLQLAQRQPDFSPIPPTVIWVVLLAFIILFFGYVARISASINRRVLSGMVVFESIGIAAAVLLDPAVMRFDDLILYHIVFWLFYPVYARKEWRRLDFRSLARSSFIVSIAVIGSLFALVFSTQLAAMASKSQWDMWARYTAYFHIWSSFFLSHLNPSWLRGFFGYQSKAVKVESIARS
jgi:hypothetical protein